MPERDGPAALARVVTRHRRRTARIERTAIGSALNALEQRGTLTDAQRDTVRTLVFSLTASLPTAPRMVTQAATADEIADRSVRRLFSDDRETR